MGDTKAKINFAEGVIELEGSEGFVLGYLEEFKKFLSTGGQEFKNKHQSKAEKQHPKKKKVSTSNVKSPENNERGQKKTSNRKRSASKVKAERFDIHQSGDTPALKAFIEGKDPGRANGNIIACIGYYITELRGQETFSEGQVEYAYKMLNLKRPQYLRQIMINEKNKRDLFEPVEEGSGSWVLTRTGEIYVSELPKGG